MANILTAGQEVSCCALGHPLRSYTFNGPWLRSDEAAAYVGCRHRCGCPSIKAFWNWRQRHGVITHRNLISKADLDAVIRRPQSNSLARRFA
jgi:hypothetical protein